MTKLSLQITSLSDFLSYVSDQYFSTANTVRHPLTIQLLNGVLTLSIGFSTKWKSKLIYQSFVVPAEVKSTESTLMVSIDLLDFLWHVQHSKTLLDIETKKQELYINKQPVQKYEFEDYEQFSNG